MRARHFFALPLLPIILACQPSTATAQVSYSQPTARVVRNADGTRLSIKVDPHVQRVEEVLEDANKTVLWRLVKELDDAFQPLRAVKYDAQNRVISRHHYLVLRGRMEEEEIRDANDRLLSKLVFYYDTKGRMTRIEQLNAQGAVISVSRSSGPDAPSTPTQQTKQPTPSR
jgi:hypothetical protein